MDMHLTISVKFLSDMIRSIKTYPENIGKEDTAYMLWKAS
jgi:hypothetical protein